MIEHMAPQRPPEAHIISESAGARPLGVLTLRCDNQGLARSMAVQALVVDLGWSVRSSVSAILGADVQYGRWRRVPDRDDDNGHAQWLMVQAKVGVLRGSSPGWYFRFSEKQDQADREVA